MLPEEYYINRGEDVIGADGPSQGDENAQTPVYQALAQIVLDLKIKKVTDMGCNVGVLGLFLKRAGYEGVYVGVDSNPHALALAQANLEDAGVEFELIEGNLRYPERNYYINCFVMKDVLQHMESLDLLRAAMKSTVKYLLISNFIPWIEGPSQIMPTDAGYFLNEYGWDEVREIAAECSFAVKGLQDVTDLGGNVNQIVLFERVKKS